MAQTAQGQARAQRKWANDAIGTLRKNENAHGKVAPALSPNVSVGATTHNQTALIKAKKIENAGL